MNTFEKFMTEQEFDEDFLVYDEKTCRWAIAYVSCEHGHMFTLEVYGDENCASPSETVEVWKGDEAENDRFFLPQQLPENPEC